MKYTSQDKPFPRGEICIKGANIFQGYYNAPDKTAEVLVDGWNLTGDVGTWDAQGRLKIIDRVKNIFKLAQGEYIAPEKVEVVLNKFELVGQSFVYGDSLQAHIVAVVVPDWETLNPWAQQNGFKHSSLEEVCADPKVNALMLKLLMAHCKENDLKGFETPRTIHLDAEPFSAENQLLSPTFKLKRHEAKNKYLKQIEQMYKQ